MIAEPHPINRAHPVDCPDCDYRLSDTRPTCKTCPARTSADCDAMQPCPVLEPYRGPSPDGAACSRCGRRFMRGVLVDPREVDYTHCPECADAVTLGEEIAR